MEQARYSAGAIILHWLIAIAVIVNWRIAEAGEHLEMAEKIEVMNRHKALGMTILALTILRVLWRLAQKPPALSSTLKPWEAMLARTVHLLFYVLLIGLPIGGWIANSAYGQGVDIFGLFTVPALPVPNNPDLGERIFGLHAAGGTVMLALIALHIVGALKHQFFDRDGNLYRMLPFGTLKG